MRSDATGRVLRTVLQLVAGGGLAALISALSDGVSPVVAAILALAGTLAATTAQNLLEETGAIPAVFKPVAVSEVVDTAGAVVGEVTGMVPADIEEVTGTVFSDAGKVVGGVDPIDEDEESDT